MSIPDFACVGLNTMTDMLGGYEVFVMTGISPGDGPFQMGDVRRTQTRCVVLHTQHAGGGAEGGSGRPWPEAQAKYMVRRVSWWI